MRADVVLSYALIAVFLFGIVAFPAPVPAQTAEESAIRTTLEAYNAALNGGQTAAVLPLYTDDGVFMPPYASPPWVRMRSRRLMTPSSTSSSLTSSSTSQS
jgi:hypothetical protein